MYSFRAPCIVVLAAFNRARERNRYRRSPDSAHKYTAEEERRLRWRGSERRERERERGGRTKGEPTNCYTALWCHSSLLRHGPGIVGMVSASSPLLSLIPSACVRPLLSSSRPSSSVASGVNQPSYHLYTRVNAALRR